MKRAINIALDVLALLMVALGLIPVGYIVLVAAVFLGVEWYEWLIVGVAALFILWRYERFNG